MRIRSIFKSHFNKRLRGEFQPSEFQREVLEHMNERREEAVSGVFACVCVHACMCKWICGGLQVRLCLSVTVHMHVY